jgi:hypothetical protein
MFKRYFRQGILGLFIPFLMVMFLHAQRAAVLIDPIKAILDAFSSHAVVALGEGGHGNNQGHQFLLALVRDRRFSGVVNDIVVEFGNSRYQGLIDRFENGENIAEPELRRVWQDTTQPFATFDLPIYEEFVQAIRSINQALPKKKRIRVWLGEPPIDWAVVRTREDAAKWLAFRDSYPADVIRHEVAKGRRALLLYGDMHFVRKRLEFNYQPTSQQYWTITNRLEDVAPKINVFTIWTNTYADLTPLQPEVGLWPKPRLVVLRGTPIGVTDFTFFYPFDNSRVSEREGKLVPIPKEEWRKLSIEDVFDALLYLGRPADITYAKVSAQLCANQAYLTMRTSRLRLAGFVATADRFAEQCGK